MTVPAYVGLGSWSCENSSALRARRRNSETSRMMKLSHPAKSRLCTALENCIFYISPMYEFSHSQGHKATSSVEDFNAFAMTGHCPIVFASSELWRLRAHAR